MNHLISYHKHELLVTDEMKKAAVKVLESGHYTLSVNDEQFGQEFADFCQTKYGIPVSSGTAGLHLSMVACELNPGDEVITPPNSFIASANCILYQKAIPVFVDVDPETYTLDVEKVEKAITPRTKAILPVHLWGHPTDMDPILELAEAHDLLVVEDAAHAAGSKYKNRFVGGLGDLGVFSFHSKCIICGGAAGMVTTNNEELADTLYKIRDHGGRHRHPHPTGDEARALKSQRHSILGWNYRIGEMEAAIGRLSLKLLPRWNKQRREHARIYTQHLEEISDIKTPVEKSWGHHIYLHYPIRVPNKRDALQDYLEAQQIQTAVPYDPPLHLTQLYQEQFHYTEGLFPNAEQEKQEILSLPTRPSLTNEEQQTIIKEIKRFNLT